MFIDGVDKFISNKFRDFASPSKYKFKVHFLLLNIFLTRCQLAKDVLNWEEKCLVTSVVKRLYRKMAYIDNMKLANVPSELSKEVLN